MQYDDNYVMTIRDVALYLQLSDSTVYKLVKKGMLPACKIGGTWRFSRKLVDAWFEQETYGGKSAEFPTKSA